MSLKGKCRKNGTVSAAAVKGKEITEINRAPSQPKTDFFGKILYAFLVEGKILNIRRMSRSTMLCLRPFTEMPTL